MGIYRLRKDERRRNHRGRRRHDSGKPRASVGVIERLEERRMLSGDPRVYDAHATVAGETLQQWSADWWSRMLSIQAPVNPLLDTTGADAALGGVGNAFFLAGVGFGAPSTVTRDITVPSDTPIFFPVLNAYADNSGIPPTNFTEADLRAFAAQLVGADTTPPNNVLHASLDGVAIGDLLGHRELSPTFSYTMPFTHGLYQDAFGLPITGTISGAVSDEYWVMLKPLSNGSHTIHFDGGVPGQFSLDVTYNITVLPKQQYEKQNPQVQIFDAHTHGVQQASADQWKWILSFSTPNDPISDTTGAFANLKNDGPIYFLAGDSGGSVNRTFDVPAGRPILVPLANAELSTLEGAGNTPQQVRDAVKQLADNIDSLHATIDGVALPTDVLFGHREVSPVFHFVSAPNNPIGDPAGDSGIAVADGYWLLLAPLPAGTHTINFGGGFASFGLAFDITDTITVADDGGGHGHSDLAAAPGQGGASSFSTVRVSPWDEADDLLHKASGHGPLKG
jgi:hypothetical protein